MWTDLRERRPGQLLAFMPEPEAQLMAETLVALANSDGGTILILSLIHISEPTRPY